VTARTRSALTPALVLLAAAVLAYAISLIPTLGVAHGSTPAHAAAVVVAPEPAGSGSALEAPPVVTPTELPTVDEVSQLWRRGEYLGAGILVLFGLLVFGLRVDRKRALYYTAGLAALGACVELVHAGQTPNASMLLGAALFFGALVMRSPLQPKQVVATEEPQPPALDPDGPEAARIRLRSGYHDQRGHIALPLLGCVAVVFLAGLAHACAPLRPSAKAAAGDLVDCTLVAVGDHADELEAAIRDATDMRGEIDWETSRALVRQLGTATGGCALRLAIERLLAAPGVAAIGGTGSLRAGWEQVRAEDLGGRRYLPEAM
jgi:hypothetical protein